MASTIAIAGRMKQAPPSISPAQPARRRLSTMASGVELGPGRTLTAPNRSRKGMVSNRRGNWRSVRQRWCPARCPTTAAGASLVRLGGLEQLDHVAGGILQQNLGAARAADDVVAEPAAGGAQPLDLAGQVVHLQLQAVPAARNRLDAV